MLEALGPELGGALALVSVKHQLLACTPVYRVVDEAADRVLVLGVLWPGVVLDAFLGFEEKRGQPG